MSHAPFINRRQAGEVLATRLTAYANRPGVLVLALPRGGVPVAYEVARVLKAPLDVMVVRKLGLPGQEELAIGAIAAGGGRVLNTELVADLHLPGEVIERVARVELQELARRENRYRGNQPPLDVTGKTVILIDDGLATGTTMHAALQAVKRQTPARLVIAVPVAPADTINEFRPLVDEIVCTVTPAHFYALGAWYQEFPQVSDEEVCRLLNEAAQSFRPD